jgi:hypothetical protein
MDRDNGPELAARIVALQDFLVAFYWYFCNFHGDAPLYLALQCDATVVYAGGMHGRRCKQTTRHA